jgi:Uma2 family endonuclease
VIYGRVELVAGRPDTATNPVVLVEALSEATREYDRGKKFDLYKAIPTLKEYLTVEQNAVLIEHWYRSRSGWTVRKHTRSTGVVRLHTQRIPLQVSETYREALG